MSTTRDWSFSQLTEELISILRERYPNGLTTSIAPPKTTPVPQEGELKLIFGVLKSPNDPSKGWTLLKAKATDTLGSLQFHDRCIIAFTLEDPAASNEKDTFPVIFPMLEDE